MMRSLALATALFLVLGLSIPTAQAQTATTSATTEQVKEKKPPTAKQQAARNRMKTCGAEWKQVKAKGTTSTWRDFSKECLKRKN